VFAPILRAGMGLIEGISTWCRPRRWPTSGCIAIRSPLVAVEYYFNHPRIWASGW